MNIFAYVKAAVTTRQAAIFYGLEVSANGMTCCPFHPDKHPSMKVDERYYCFGCHQTGDVIDFVGHLFGMMPYQAARKLAEDFGLHPGRLTRRPCRYQHINRSSQHANGKDAVLLC